MTQTSKHTLGPWLLFPDGDFQSRPQFCETWEQVEQQQRHAHDVTDGNVDYVVVSVPQIQAIPDLLAACEALFLEKPPFSDSHSPYWTINEDERRFILAAIAKARGQQEGK